MATYNSYVNIITMIAVLDMPTLDHEKGVRVHMTFSRAGRCYPEKSGGQFVHLTGQFV